MAHIRLQDDTADVLHELKNRGDSYDDVVKRLIAESQLAEIDVENREDEAEAA